MLSASGADLWNSDPVKSQELQHLPVSVQRVGSCSQRAECFLTLSFVWSLGSPPGNAAAELCSLPALLTPFHSPNTGPDPIPLHTEQVRSDCKAHWMRIEFTVPVFSIKELEDLLQFTQPLGYGRMFSSPAEPSSLARLALPPSQSAGTSF